MAVPAPRATSGMECRAASFVSDSTSTAFSGNAEANGCPASGCASSAACRTKRVPKISSMLLRASSGMSFITRLSTTRALRGRSGSTLHPHALFVAHLNGICRDIGLGGGSRSREVGRGGAEGCVQMPGCQPDDREHHPQDGELERGVVADRLSREDQAGYERHRERDAPVEAPRLRVRPGVHRAYDLPPLVGVSALGLHGAVVANLGSGAVAYQAPPMIHLASEEDLVLRTDPSVVRGMVGEPGGAVALRAGVRVAGKEVEPEGDTDQEDRVAYHQQNLRMDGHYPTAPATRSLRAVISVKSISSGSSTTTRGTVWRTPR